MQDILGLQRSILARFHKGSSQISVPFRLLFIRVPPYYIGGLEMDQT